MQPWLLYSSAYSLSLASHYYHDEDQNLKLVWNFCVIWSKLLLLFHLTPCSSLAFESQYHNYIEKFFFFLFTLVAWVLYSLMHYHTLRTTHLKSGRQGLKKIKHKTQKQEDESMFSGNVDGSLNVVILLLLYFLEFKNISKIIHKVIYLGKYLRVKWRLTDGWGWETFISSRILTEWHFTLPSSTYF